MSMSIKLVLAFILMIVFLVPTVTFESKVINYTPRPTLTDENPTPATPTEKGDPTTLHKSFNNTIDFFKDLKIPLGWNIIVRSSTGFTFGLINGLGRPLDLEESFSTFNISSIKDPALREEISNFHPACYVPAIGKLENWRTTQNITKELQDRMDDADPGDLLYLGSKVLLETPGLYAPCKDIDKCQGTIKSPIPIASFMYNPSRDKYHTANDIKNNVPGKPYCDEWWISILDRILKEESAETKSAWEGFKSKVGTEATRERVERIRVQRALSNTEERAEILLGNIPGASFGESTIEAQQLRAAATGAGGTALVLAKGAGKKVKGLLSPVRKVVLGAFSLEAAYTGFNAYAQYRKMSYLKRAVPVIIAILMFIMPIIIPFALVWGMYQFKTVITLAITFFAIRFLTALFEIGVFLQSSVFDSIISDWTDMAAYVTGQGLVGGAETVIVLAFLIPVIFLLVPLIFLALAARFGVMSLSGITQSYNESQNNIGAGIKFPGIGKGKGKGK